MSKITAIGEILFDVYPDSKNMGGAPLNFLYHVFKLTGQGNIISRLGHDVLGDKARDFLDKNGIPTNFIQVDHKHPTGVTTVTLNEDKVPTFSIDVDRAYDFIEYTDALEKLINEETDCLYFGSLAQRSETTGNTIRSFLDKKINYFCDLNIRQKFFNEETIIRSVEAADVLKVNIDELEFLHKLFQNNRFDIVTSSADLMKRFNIDLIAVTKGAEGSILIRNDEHNEFKMSAGNVTDTLGAGDAFAAILCIGYLEGWDLENVNRLANEFAFEICKIKGALPGDDSVYDTFKRKIDNA